MDNDDTNDILWTNEVHVFRRFRYYGGKPNSPPLEGVVYHEAPIGAAKAYIEKFPDGGYYIHHDGSHRPESIDKESIVAGPFPTEESTMAAVRILIGD